MISILLIDQHRIAETKKNLASIIANTSDLNKIEVIITTNHFDQVALFKQELLHRYPLRIIIKSHGSFTVAKSVREILNFAYCQLHPDSQLVVPIFSQDATFALNWDLELKTLIDYAEREYKHKLYVISDQDQYFFTTPWLDVNGGFGPTQQIKTWTFELLNQVEEKLGTRLEVLTATHLILNNQFIEIQEANIRPMLTTLRDQQVTNIIACINELADQGKHLKQLNKMDLIETCHYIAENFPVMETYSLLLNRYFMEATPDIISNNTFPLLQVFLTAILNAREMLDRELISEDLSYLDAWEIKEMPTLKKA